MRREEVVTRQVLGTVIKDGQVWTGEERGHPGKGFTVGLLETFYG